MLEFLFGVVCGVLLVVLTVIFGVPQLDTILKNRLDRMAKERKEKLASQVKASAKVDLYKVASIRPAALKTEPHNAAVDTTPVNVMLVSGVLTISTVPGGRSAVGQSFQRSAAAPSASSCGERSMDLKAVGSHQVLAQFRVGEFIASMGSSKTTKTHLVLTPKPGTDLLGDISIPEVSDDGETTVTGRLDLKQLVIQFFTVREAERFWCVLSPSPATGEWQRIMKQIPGESVLNVLLARILFENNSTPALAELISSKIQKKLKLVKLPQPLDGTLKLHHLSVGEDPPNLSDIRLAGKSITGEFGFDFNVVYPGGFTIILSASVNVRRVKIPPIIVTVKVEELSGRIHVSIGAPPSDKMWIAFHEEPKLKIDFRQEVQTDLGVLALLASAVPDLSGVVTSIIKEELFDDMVLPNLDDFPIPNVADTPPTTPEQQALPMNTASNPQWNLDFKHSKTKKPSTVTTDHEALDQRPDQQTLEVTKTKTAAVKNLATEIKSDALSTKSKIVSVLDQERQQRQEGSLMNEENHGKPHVASANDKPSAASANDKPSAASANEKPSAASANDKPSAASANEKPSAASANEKPSAASANDKPSAASANEKPSAASANDKPSAASANDKPSAASANEKPSAASANEKPSAASANEMPSAASANDKPSAASANEKPDDASASEKNRGKPHAASTNTEKPSDVPGNKQNDSQQAKGPKDTSRAAKRSVNAGEGNEYLWAGPRSSQSQPQWGQ